MRILLVDQYGEMGGAQHCLLEMAMGFCDRGWDVHAVLPDGPAAHAVAQYCTTVHHLACGPFHSEAKTLSDRLRFAGQMPWQAGLIARIAHRHQADVVYVNGPRVLPAAVIANRGMPLIYHVHSMPRERSAARIVRSILRRTRSSAIASTRLAAHWLQGAVPADRLSIIYNGVAGLRPERTSNPRTHKERISNIAVLGRISPEKGQLEFARAARIASEHIRGLRFVVCGAPLFADQNYFNQVRTAAAGSVEFRPWTDDVHAFLSEVDLLVVPSLYDGAPRVILEAFASRVPVLAFDAGAIPEVIEHGRTGLLVRDLTPEALAQAILAASAQPDLLADIAELADRRWQERYTLRRFQSEICDAVEAFAAPRNKRHPLASAGTSAAV